MESEDKEGGLYKDTPRSVMFGRVPLGGIPGLLVEHWALKIGDIWWEVSGRGGDHITNSTKKFYEIRPTEGEKSGSLAAPSVVKRWSNCQILMTFLSTFICIYAYLVLLCEWMEGSGLELKKSDENWSLLVECWWKKCDEIQTWFAFLMLVMTALLGLLTTGVITRQWLDGGKAMQTGDSNDPTLFGLTRKTDPEIKEFNSKYKTKHPMYLVTDRNCQHYVRDLLTFLMEGEKQWRSLPLLEAPEVFREGLGMDF